MLMNIWVKDKSDGYIHQVGTDKHDSLELINGKVEYVNMQCMCGTLDGDYEFVEAPDTDEYIGVTPKQLYLNRALMHKDLLTQLIESGAFEDNDEDGSKMAERCLLHQNKLDLFKDWLRTKGYEIQQPKSIYEVLRAKTDNDTIIIFKKGRAKEHLTVQQKDYKLVRQFINETKKEG